MKRSIRKPAWDYGQTASYLITIRLSTNNLRFGVLVGDRVHLNPIGETVKDRWFATPTFFPNVELGAFVIMPDHIHGIVYFRKSRSTPSSGSGEFGPQRNNLGSVIRSFKSAVTSRLKDDYPSFKWQARYHDQILFTQAAIDAASEYVRNNPRRASLRAKDHKS